MIVGGGFGGLNAARQLGREPRAAVTLVDRRNFHLFQPLLYQVATGALSPGDIAQPLRSILRRSANTTVLLGRGRRPRPGAPRGAPLGRRPDPLRHARRGDRVRATRTSATTTWAPFAPGLKSIDDALEIRRRILIAFEAAEREQNPERRREWMTFVVVGGGPTGVELAGALGEIAQRHPAPRLPLHPPARRPDHPASRRSIGCCRPTRPIARCSARRQLEKLGVDVRTGTRVVHVDERHVRVHVGRRATEEIAARTVLWAAGVQASSFVRAVAAATGAETDRAGRIVVGPDLAIPGHPEIFAIGDAAVQPWRGGRPVPGVAQGAIQPGQYVGKAIRQRLAGEPVTAFRYRDKGDVAVIGRLAGVTNIGVARPVRAPVRVQRLARSGW